MLKLFMTGCIKMFVNIVLAGKEGDTILNGKGFIKKADPAILDLDFGEDCKYEITVKKISKRKAAIEN